MQEIVFSFNLLLILGLVIIIFPLYFFVVRKQIFFWFDPLLIFVLFNSISVSLVIYLYMFANEISEMYFISFIVCITAFIFGLRYGGRKGLPLWKSKLSTESISTSSNKFSLIIDLFLIISLIIVVGANLSLFLVKGTLPILSDNPSRAKIMMYTGGWGIVRRINFVMINFILVIPFFKLFHPFVRPKKMKRKFYITSIIIACLITVTMGSKGGLLILLNVLFSILLLNKVYNNSFSTVILSYTHIDKIKKYAKYILAITISFMVLVIALSGFETTGTDALITRLVSYGDVYYFFYKYDLILDFKESSLDYIPHILNPLTSMFRLTSYEYSIGALVVNYSIGIPLDKAASFGPNAQHPIEGLIYFGKFGAPFYSFFIGWFISYVRIGMIRNLGATPNNYKLFVYTYLSSLVITAATDMPLFMQKFYDSLFFGSIIFSIIISMFIFSKLIQR